MMMATGTNRQLGRGMAVAAVVLAVLLALAVSLAVAAWMPSRAFAASRTGDLAAGTADAAGALDATGATGPAGTTDPSSASESAGATDFASASEAAGAVGSLSIQATKAAKKAKSGKQTVYVITGVKTDSATYTNSDDKVLSSETTKKRLIYAKNGLLKKTVLKSSKEKGKVTVKYSYKSKRLARVVTKNTLPSNDLLRSNYVCSYEKGGRVVNAKLKEVYKDGSGGPATRARAVFDKSGRLKKVTETKYLSYSSVRRDIATGELIETTDYLPTTYINTYKHKGKKIIWEFDNGTDVRKYTIKLDKHGNAVDADDVTYDDEGRLVKCRSVTSGFQRWSEYTAKYTYKAIKVPASMVAKIEAQQWTILNGNYNGALGVL